MASVPVNGVFRTTLRIGFRHPLAFLKANLTWSLYAVIGTPTLTREAFFSADIPPDRLTEYFRMAHDMMLETGWRSVADRIIQWLDGKVS